MTRIEELEEAIRTHRSQKADDRCIEDDDRLYAVLNDGIKCDRRVGDQCAMLENCKRFIKNRTEGGGWPGYAELEAALKESQRREAVLRWILKYCPDVDERHIETMLNPPLCHCGKPSSIRVMCGSGKWSHLCEDCHEQMMENCLTGGGEA